jgi:hypothetical protein
MKLIELMKMLLALGNLHLNFAKDLGLRQFTESAPLYDVLDVPSFE